MNSLAETDRAYLAGLADGEGSFTVLKVRNRNGTFHPSPCIIIGLTSEETLKYVRETLGFGLIYKRKPYPYFAPHWKPLWIFRINKIQHVMETLVAMLPYLKIKRGQAELLIKFCESRLERRRAVKANRYAPIMDTDWKIAEEIWSMNRGIPNGNETK